MDLGNLNKVWEIKHLKKVDEDEARKILQKIAKQVQPITKRHQWRVKILSEFCPANPSRLGLNVGGGVEIKLRLRRPNRDWDFIPYEQVLDTMLHELCHNQHAPHNDSFYKLWDEIRKECEELISKGINGTGQEFDGPGRRLGGFSHQPPLSSLRHSALSAAEKRKRVVRALLPSGPKQVGGDSNIMIALSSIQAAAMAAERRLKDDLWCASVSRGESSLEESDLSMQGQLDSKKCSKSLEASIIDLTDCSHDSFSSLGFSGIDRTGTSSSGHVLNHFITDGKEVKATWECSICTLFNQPLALICEACGTQKPKDIATKFKVWSCKFCTLENSVKLDKCTACGQWRYSYGPPISTHGPHLSI